MGRGKIHYRSPRSGSAACGDKKVTPAWSTSIVEMVSCKKCKRARTFYYGRN